jgi:chlorobactene glucosyltransferase
MLAYAYDLEAFVIVTLTALIFAVFSAWLYFLIYTIISFKRVPKLESANEQQQGNMHTLFISGHNRYPKVSVILPARNEEKYIAKCLDSLINQSYPNLK